MKIEKDNVGRKYVDIKTAHGAIRVTQDAWGKDYPGISVDFIPDGCQQGYQVAVVEDLHDSDAFRESSENKTLSVKVWGNPWDEDPTHEKHIPIRHIEGYLKDEDMMLKCPECGKENPRELWNYITEDHYGEGITPLLPEDFGGELHVAAECNYICPYCGKEVIGKDVIKATNTAKEKDD